MRVSADKNLSMRKTTWNGLKTVSRRTSLRPQMIRVLFEIACIRVLPRLRCLLASVLSVHDWSEVLLKPFEDYAGPILHSFSLNHALQYTPSRSKEFQFLSKVKIFLDSQHPRTFSGIESKTNIPLTVWISMTNIPCSLQNSLVPSTDKCAFCPSL